MASRFWPQVVESPAETQEVEYKADVPLSDNLNGIVKAALAMSNTENGGVIVIGVADNQGRCTATGLSQENLQSYKVQTLAEQILSYGSEGMRVTARIERHGDNEYITIEVLPFDGQYPVICMKGIDSRDLSKGVRQGTTYYRDQSCRDAAVSESTHKLVQDRAFRNGLRTQGPFIEDIVRQTVEATRKVQLEDSKGDGYEEELVDLI